MNAFKLLGKIIFFRNFGIEEVVQKTDKDYGTKFKDDEEMTCDIRDWSPFTSDFKVSLVFILIILSYQL